MDALNSQDLHFLGNRSEFEDKDESDKPKKKAARHSRRSTKILKEWFATHKAYPYPTDEEKELLSEATGLDSRQLSYWFVNARRRNGVSRQEKPELVKDTSVAQQATGLSHSQVHSGMTPLDRWRNSPPEEEPVPLHVINQSLGHGLLSFSSEPDLRWSSAYDSANFNNDAVRPGSITSDSTNQSQSSGSSAKSCSSGSVASIYSCDRRRRRRRKIVVPQWIRQKDTPKDSRIFQCTFCTDTFKSRYDWTRHEGTLHLVLEKWTCLPFGPKYSDPSEGIIRCSLCNEVEPSDLHLQSHRYAECTSKPLSKRSFYRKDHLRQHLRVSHGVSDLLPSMKSWKSKVTDVNSRCGFCGETFTVWADRNDHLADHFRSGALMKDWTGCRGLEPAIALLVQNAIPPYLIGAESNDPEPFSASRAALKTDAGPGGEALPTAFESLTARLGEYVSKMMEQGILITDDMLKREARLLMYSDDDPLNYTPADNAFWLNLFKQGHGLASTSTQVCEYNNPPLPQDSTAEDKVHLPMSSPFTMEKMLQAAMSDSTAIPLHFGNDIALQGQSGCEFFVPWSWQTPECLAEFRQMCQSTSTGMAMFEGQTCSPGASAGADAAGLVPESACFAGKASSGRGDISDLAYGLAGPPDDVEQQGMDLLFHSELFDTIVTTSEDQDSQQT